MDIVKVGPNGEVTLPRAILERLGLRPGMCARLDSDQGHPDCVYLFAYINDNEAAEHPIKDNAPGITKAKTLDDLIGIGGKVERAFSQEEIDRIVRQRALAKIADHEAP